MHRRPSIKIHVLTLNLEADYDIYPRFFYKNVILLSSLKPLLIFKLLSVEA